MTALLTASRRRDFVATSAAVGVARTWLFVGLAVLLLVAGLGLADLGFARSASTGSEGDAGAMEIPLALPMGPVARVIVPVEVAPAVASYAMEASAPVQLAIPSIGVNTPLMDLGLMPDGTLEVPPDGSLAGWYTGARTPGERGPAIIAGHVDWHGPAVFHDLSLVAPGDAIEVSRADGSLATFEVTEVGQYSKADFPTEAVYGSVDVAALRLITCGGVFDRATGHYVDNIVVYAVLVAPEDGASP